jgi:hypothetical protein
MIAAFVPFLLLAAEEVAKSPLTPPSQAALIQNIGYVGNPHPCYDETIEVSLLLSKKNIASEIEVLGPPCARHEVEAIKRFFLSRARYVPVRKNTRFRFRIRLTHAAE